MQGASLTLQAQLRFSHGPLSSLTECPAPCPTHLHAGCEPNTAGLSQTLKDVKQQRAAEGTMGSEGTPSSQVQGQGQGEGAQGAAPPAFPAAAAVASALAVAGSGPGSVGAVDGAGLTAGAAAAAAALQQQQGLGTAATSAAQSLSAKALARMRVSSGGCSCSPFRSLPLPGTLLCSPTLPAAPLTLPMPTHRVPPNAAWPHIFDITYPPTRQHYLPPP